MRGSDAVWVFLVGEEKSRSVCRKRYKSPSSGNGLSLQGCVLEVYLYNNYSSLIAKGFQKLIKHNKYNCDNILVSFKWSTSPLALELLKMPFGKSYFVL